MTKRKQVENATSTPEATGISAGHGYGVEAPHASAGLAAGAVGPGAVAAAEMPKQGGELAPGDRETLRSLVKVAGGVDALIRWLQLHPEIEREPSADLSQSSTDPSGTI